MYNEAYIARVKRNTPIGKVKTAAAATVMSLRGLSTFNSVSILVLQVIAFAVLCILYLGFSNRYITQGYVVNRLESERRQLIIQNEVSNRLVEEAKALASVRKYADAHMIPVARAEYIDAHTASIALSDR